jgi:quercetin dioxygenase-like cupin family protein
MWTRKLHAASLAAVIAIAYSPASTRGTHHEGATAGSEQEPHAIVTPSTEVQWKAGPAALPPGAKFTVLEGDPAKEGMFTLRVSVPAGYRIPPHTHPKVERVTVLSGEIGLGMGPDFDESKLAKMPAGSFFVLQPGMQHFVEAAADTVIQLNAQGPWGITYVRASDDPRNAPQARKGTPPASGTRRTP